MSTTLPPHYVEISGEYGTLRGFWQAPAGQNVGFPAVVLLHGLSGSTTANGFIFVNQARQLAAAGIASLRVDFFGSGNSDGDHKDMSIWTEVSDAKRIFDYAYHQPGVDPGRLGVLGYSFGGLIAALLTDVEPRIQALVAWSPALDARGGETDPANIREQRSFGGVLLGPAYIQSAFAVRPLEALSRFTRPTLVVHGDADETVPMGSGALFAEKTGGRLVLVKGANHGYERPTWRDELYSETTCHFVEHLRA